METLSVDQYRKLPKAKSKPRQRESALQQACVKWFRLQYPKYRDLLFSIPNEARRNARNAARMKAQGMVAGVPDVFLAFTSGWEFKAGMFIELKVAPNKVTDLQERMIERLRKEAYRVEVCYSLQQFQDVVNDYLAK